MPFVPALRILRSARDQLRSMIVLWWPRSVAMCSYVYVLYTLMTAEDAAAKEAPPLLKEHKRQLVVENSCIRWRSSTVIEYMRSLFVPNRSRKPSGWMDTLRRSSIKRLLSRQTCSA